MAVCFALISLLTRATSNAGLVLPSGTLTIGDYDQGLPKAHVMLTLVLYPFASMQPILIFLFLETAILSQTVTIHRARTTLRSFRTPLFSLVLAEDPPPEPSSLPTVERQTSRSHPSTRPDLKMRIILLQAPIQLLLVRDWRARFQWPYNQQPSASV